MSRCKLVCFFHCKKLDVVVGDPNIYDKDSLHYTILFGTSLHCTESTALHRTVFKVHFTSGSTGQHNFSEAVRLSVNMRVKSHATISTWWPGHLVGGLSCLTWPAKDTSWECPPHILQCHLHNVGGGCTSYQSGPDLTLGAQGNLMRGSRTELYPIHDTQ